jgi:hypothetical protein
MQHESYTKLTFFSHVNLKEKYSGPQIMGFDNTRGKCHKKVLVEASRENQSAFFTLVSKLWFTIWSPMRFSSTVLTQK